MQMYWYMIQFQIGVEINVFSKLEPQPKLKCANSKNVHFAFSHSCETETLRQIHVPTNHMSTELNANEKNNPTVRVGKHAVQALIKRLNICKSWCADA